MGKKLSDIKELIEASRFAFYEYLLQTEDKMVMNLIHDISSQTRVFIFSGVIRNFFLGEKNNRDIDIILEKEIDIPAIFVGAEIKRNSFGGYKIVCNNTTIDLWYLENTWAFKNEPLLNFDLEIRVPGTAFFNFSSIIFSFNDKCFYYDNEFVKFLRDQEIDVVNTKNPNYKLCVVNTFYYSDKYQLKIKKRLKAFIVDLYQKLDKDYTEVQLKHFGKIMYPNEIIEHRMETIYYRRKIHRRKPKLDLHCILRK